MRLVGDQVLAARTEQEIQEAPALIRVGGAFRDQRGAQDRVGEVLQLHHLAVAVFRKVGGRIAAERVVGEPHLAALDPSGHLGRTAHQLRVEPPHHLGQPPEGVGLARVLGEEHVARAGKLGVVHGDPAMEAVGVVPEQLQQVAACAGDRQIGEIGPADQQHHRVLGDAVKQVAPVRPARHAGRGRGPVGGGKAVIGQLDLQVHGGRDHQVIAFRAAGDRLVDVL